uniref:Uncharacterized protein n=1 Tax=Aegilops tauschii TaxID=37682 RepID=M8BBX9_AEGTA
MPPRRLPEPVIRLGNSSVGSKANIAAVGSKIVVTGKRHHRYGDIIITLVYDTKMARLDNQEPPPASFRLLPRYRWCDCQRAVAVGNKLYMFDYGCSPPHYLCQQQGVEFRGGYFTQDEDETMLDMRGQTMEWIWKNGPSFPGQEELRFVHPVQSHAVHPDGRTIFVSCFGDPNNHCKAPFTFSLDTKHGVDLDTVQDTEHAGDLDTVQDTEETGACRSRATRTTTDIWTRGLGSGWCAEDPTFALATSQTSPMIMATRQPSHWRHRSGGRARRSSPSSTVHRAMRSSTLGVAGSASSRQNRWCRFMWEASLISATGAPCTTVMSTCSMSPCSVLSMARMASS